MSLGQRALEIIVVVIFFWIVFGRMAQNVPFIKELWMRIFNRKATASINNGEVKKQIWPENRAMI